MFDGSEAAPEPETTIDSYLLKRAPLGDGYEPYGQRHALGDDDVPPYRGPLYAFACFMDAFFLLAVVCYEVLNEFYQWEDAWTFRVLTLVVVGLAIPLWVGRFRRNKWRLPRDMRSKQ